mgnify:CR=1 FL=1
MSADTTGPRAQHTDPAELLNAYLDDEVDGPATITSGGKIINARTRAAMGLEEAT